MTETVTAQEALVHVMVTMCVADRDMASVELTSIRTLVERLPVFAGFEVDDLSRIAEKTAAMLNEENGLDTILALVKESLPTKLHETAYALAVEIASADVVARQEELRFLEMMRDELDVPTLAAAAIEHSARVRYRKA